MPIRYVALAAILCSVSALAQPSPQAEVPVRRVALFSSGVGYYEHAGPVRGDAEVVLRFSEPALNDVLKSLVVEDRGGRVAEVVYPSEAPLARRLGAFAVDPQQLGSLGALLGQLRGAVVTVETPSGAVRGTVAGVANRPTAVSGTVVNVEVVTLVTAAGLRAVPLHDAVAVTLDDPGLQAELDEALAALASARSEDKLPVRIRLRGAGARDTRIGYVVEAPVWKTSYRLELPESARGDGFLQGWAVVENQTESDWEDVAVTLVSGRPLAFVMDLYTPLYTERPVVNVREPVLVDPQAYAAGRQATSHVSTSTGGPAGRIGGVVRDARTGEGLPGANVVLDGTPHGAATDLDGRFTILGVPPGSYGLTVSFVGFVPARAAVTLPSSAGLTVTATLVEDAVGLDEVTVAYERPIIQRDAIGAPSVGYYTDGAGARSLALRGSAQALGSTGDLGELFAYTLGAVSIPRRTSAMLPIVTDEVTVERLSIYDPSALARHPLRGVRITNTSGKDLLGGPVTVFDEGYGGDALLPDLPAGQDRLLSFAVDQEVLVDVERPAPAGAEIVAGRIVDGVLSLQRRTVFETTYLLENRDDEARTVVVVHAREPGTDLADTATPEEQLPGAARFRLRLSAGGSEAFRVREARVVGETVALVDQPQAVLEGYASSSELPGDVRRALGRAVALQQEVAEAERAVQEAEAELNRLQQEQARIRGNMGAVDRQSAYYRRLLDKLDEQETEIEGLDARLDALRAEAAQRRDALRQSLRGLTVG